MFLFFGENNLSGLIPFTTNLLRSPLVLIPIFRFSFTSCSCAGNANLVFVVGYENENDQYDSGCPFGALSDDTVGWVTGGLPFREKISHQQSPNVLLWETFLNSVLTWRDVRKK